LSSPAYLLKPFADTVSDARSGWEHHRVQNSISVMPNECFCGSIFKNLWYGYWRFARTFIRTGSGTSAAALSLESGTTRELMKNKQNRAFGDLVG